jgi:hypothetical protein
MLASSQQTEWVECAPPCPVSAYNAIFGNIISMARPIFTIHELRYLFVAQQRGVGGGGEGGKGVLCLDGWFCEQLYILLYGSSAVALYSLAATK